MSDLAQAVPVPRTDPAKARPVSKLWGPLAIGVLGVWLYAPILLHLVKQWWSDPNFSHGFLVPIFSGFVLWQKRAAIASATRKPSLWGLAIIVLALLMLVVGSFGAELFLSRVSLVVLAAGMVIFFLGWAMFVVVLFPLLILLLMIPIPAIVFSQITFPLQILASKLAAWLLPLIGVPVLREGNIINLPSMPLEVAQACS